jgi:hypothetical protein
MLSNLPLRQLNPRVSLAFVLWLLFSLLIPSLPARAQNSVSIPSGFRLIDSAQGVQLYRKDYQNGKPDFVQLVDLSQGAAVEVLHGKITAKREGRGAYGGADPRLTSRNLEDYWQEIRDQFRSAFCVTNGQFFYMPEYPTRLPFPLKKDGQIISEGYGVKEYPDQKLMLELWADRANIQPLSAEALHSSTAPDVIAGLTEIANKRARHSVGRTFMGIADYNGDSVNETVLVFNTSSAKQSDAAEILRKFGAGKVMMLDGGGSTQLLCGKKSYIDSERLIPQAIAVIAAPSGKIPQPTPVMAAVEPTLAPTPQAQVAVIELTLATTSPPQVALVEAPTPLPQAVAPRGHAGVYVSRLLVTSTAGSENQVLSPAGKQFLPLIHSNREPLPGELAAAPLPDLQLTPPALVQTPTPGPDQSLALVQPETTSPQAGPETLAQAPDDENLQFDLSGVLLVPLSMLPVVGALFFAINKIQRRY